ncbi:hypothetical protein C8035_v008025 [Colletotrichum spinosum]|uniref:Uncharacterized protein n=1 Tax=Colletotrichum spinosum TaxID=1347390 RepID=A0A4R8QT37_9PEZI|nr:hypothetical protein C8035_v008025 [Colletotrichum spinosum]
MAQATTVDAVGDPAYVSDTGDTILVFATKTMSPGATDRLSTLYLSSSTGNLGTWFTDPNATPTSTSSSAVGISTFLITQSATIASASASASSTVTPDEGSSSSGISNAAKGGIIAGVAVLLLGGIATYFLCGRQRRKLRSRHSIDSMAKDGGGHEEEAAPPMSANPFQPKDHSDRTDKGFQPGEVFSQFGGRYEEPQSRFNRVSDMSSNSKMMNHPVSPMSRASSMNLPLSAAAASDTVCPANRATTSPDLVNSFNTTTSDPVNRFGIGNVSPVSRVDTTSPDFVNRMGAATPDFLNRLGTATPEIHGPPQRAAVTEIASPGLPKVVEIHSNRTGAQRYKPYRPDANALYPVAETTPSYLTGTLNATENERSQNRYVNSWSKWDSMA